MEPAELARIELPAEPASISRCRRFVTDALGAAVPEDLLDAALIVTSELATNAMLHARTGFTLVVRHDESGLRLEVHDGNPRLPRRKRYAQDSTTGRGLVLIESLATLAGAEQTDQGKVVWAVLTEISVEPPVVGAEDHDGARGPAPLTIVPDLVTLEPEVEEHQVAARGDEPGLRGSRRPDDPLLAPV